MSLNPTGSSLTRFFARGYDTTSSSSSDDEDDFSSGEWSSDDASDAGDATVTHGFGEDKEGLFADPFGDLQIGKQSASAASSAQIPEWSSDVRAIEGIWSNIKESNFNPESLKPFGIDAEKHPTLLENVSQLWPVVTSEDTVYVYDIDHQAVVIEDKMGKLLAIWKPGSKRALDELNIALVAEEGFNLGDCFCAGLPYVLDTSKISHYNRAPGNPNKKPIDQLTVNEIWEGSSRTVPITDVPLFSEQTFSGHQVDHLPNNPNVSLNRTDRIIISGNKLVGELVPFIDSAKDDDFFAFAKTAGLACTLFGVRDLQPDAIVGSKSVDYEEGMAAVEKEGPKKCPRPTLHAPISSDMRYARVLTKDQVSELASQVEVWGDSEALSEKIQRLREMTIPSSLIDLEKERMRDGDGRKMYNGHPISVEEGGREKEIFPPIKNQGSKFPAFHPLQWDAFGQRAQKIGLYFETLQQLQASETESSPASCRTSSCTIFSIALCADRRFGDVYDQIVKSRQALVRGDRDSGIHMGEAERLLHLDRTSPTRVVRQASAELVGRTPILFEGDRSRSAPLSPEEEARRASDIVKYLYAAEGDAPEASLASASAIPIPGAFESALRGGDDISQSPFKAIAPSPTDPMAKFWSQSPEAGAASQ